MDLQFITTYLFQLILIKELLIVRVYVIINSRRVKKCEYKYSNYVINFMQNIVKIVYRFSFLSIEIQIIILKLSFNNVKNNKIYRRLR